jgi:hypothetical protein
MTLQISFIGSTTLQIFYIKQYIFVQTVLYEFMGLIFLGVSIFACLICQNT